MTGVFEITGLSCESDFIERLLSTTHAIVVLMDRAGRVVLFNDYMRELSGYELDEVRGQDWFEVFIPAEERSRLRALYLEALDEVQVEANINSILTKSGEPHTIEWWGNAVHGDDGQTIGVVSVGQDITTKLELRRKLAQSERLANIGMMASVFAHEVGNPLNALYLQAQLLRRRIDRPDRGPLAPSVDTILAELTRLNQLLADFRAFHDPGKLELELTDLGEVLTTVADTLEPQVAARDVALRREIPEQLPRVAGNANKLKQVFINLCKNGVEAMGHGGTLGLRASVDGERVRVDVSDEGQGVPESVDVFAPFATTKPSGMGLGLPLVREIVRAHAGELDYVSRPGLGTTFSVTLPRRGK